MMYFLIKVNRREKINTATLEKDEDDCLMDLMDLNTALDSVAPLYGFTQYLEKHKPEYKHLLRLVKLHRMYQDQVNEFGENQQNV